MRRKLLTGVGLAALTLVVSSGLVACGGDDEVAVFDLNGEWRFELTNTSTSGVCADENGDVSSDIITITEDLPAQVGSAVTMSGFLGVATNVLDGEYVGGGVVEVGGSYPEDGGTTTTFYHLTFVNGNRLEGTEDWAWTGAGGTCPTNTASVVATRQ